MNEITIPRQRAVDCILRASQAYADQGDERTAAVLRGVAGAVEAIEPERQRPLTLEELNAGDVVYLEFKDDDEIIPIQILPEALSPNLLAYFKCGWAARFNLDMLGYGRYCRCWAQMPTDEERAAAEWEN